MEVFHGLRCKGCGHVDKVPPNRAYGLNLDEIIFSCPECGETEWEGWRESADPAGGDE